MINRCDWKSASGIDWCGRISSSLINWLNLCASSYNGRLIGWWHHTRISVSLMDVDLKPIVKRCGRLSKSNRDFLCQKCRANFKLCSWKQMESVVSRHGALKEEAREEKMGWRRRRDDEWQLRLACDSMNRGWRAGRVRDTTADINAGAELEEQRDYWRWPVWLAGSHAVSQLANQSLKQLAKQWVN